jgi:hypothetical protein
MPEPNSSQLRHKIDSGQTRDKIAFPDPAAAPLGTDDEAAGAPPSTEAVETARRHEEAPERTGSPQRERVFGLAVYLLIAAGFAAALIGAAFLAAGG